MKLILRGVPPHNVFELAIVVLRCDVNIASIKHWADQSKGLAECVRVLRPGGQLLIVEADRGWRFNDARAFVSRWRLPKAMRPLNLAMFRTFATGRSTDLEDARSLMSELPLTSWEVSRIRGTPALLMRGRGEVGQM